MTALQVKITDIKFLTVPLLFLCSLMFVAASLASETRQIHLDDGSSIIGEIISVQNGSYVIKTKSLGTVTLGFQQIEGISALGAATNAVGTSRNLGAPVINSTTSNPAATAPQVGLESSVQQIQSSIFSSAALMSSIMQMQDNPEMQAVLNDPELMQAIQRFDIEAIQNNPKIIRLMKSRDMQQIQSKVN